MEWLLVLLICVATHRLTRLAVADEVPVVKIPRDAAIKFLDPTPQQRAADPAARGHWGSTGRAFAYLLECPWCMSVWVGGFLVWITAFTVGIPWPWLVWPAASTVTGLIANYEARQDQQHELAEVEKRRALAAEQREARR
jgi:Protein of unknown function (DUF1360)